MKIIENNNKELAFKTYSEEISDSAEMDLLKALYELKKYYPEKEIAIRVRGEEVSCKLGDAVFFCDTEKDCRLVISA